MLALLLRRNGNSEWLHVPAAAEKLHTVLTEKLEL